MAVLSGLLATFYTIVSLAVPSVFPTGTTIFDPDKTWSGYTIVDAADSNGAVL